MPKKILIIDDEKELCELTENLLQTAGYQTVSRTDGDSALEVTKKEKPALIILDLLLGDKNGFEICHEVKSTAETKHIPVLMTTGRILSDGTLDEYKTMKPPDDTLVKPFELDDLLKKIRELFKKNA